MAHEIPDGDEKLFLECFPTYKLHSKPQSLSDNKSWVFSSKDDEGFENNSCSSSDKVISAFSMLELDEVYVGCIVQLWAPVTIGGRLLLSISAQPFGVDDLDECCMRYRQRCEEYGYSNGPPLSAFFSRLPEMLFLRSVDYGLRTSWMIPIFDPSESSSTSSDCIGVVEYSLTTCGDLTHFSKMNGALEKVGLGVFNVQDSIPYKTISGLKPTKEEIEEALETICESHNIFLAQVWISSEDNNHEHFSSSLLGTQMKQMLALKLTGYTSFDEQVSDDLCELKEYYDACDKIPLKQGDELVLKTFEDYEPRFYKDNSNLGTDILMADILLAGLDYDIKCSGLTIRMRSIDTSDFDYAFEFIWYPDSNYVMFLEALLLTLKRCLPRFKCASGAELGDELHVIDVDNSTKTETKTFKIFQENRSSPIPEAVEKGKKAMIVDHRANTEVNCKTAKKDLPLEVIEQQYGNTMKVAAENLQVSLSTLKRKLKVYGITEWQGPDLRKRKVYDSFNNQNCTNEKDYGAIQDPLSINRDENTLTIKAEYADDTIKFDLPISEATLNTVKKEMCTRLDLTFGTYKLKYRDEVGEWISLLSDKDMSYHMNYLKKVNKKEVRLCVCLHKR